MLKQKVENFQKKALTISVKERIYKKEYAEELFRIAQNDLKAAETLALNSEVRPETALLMVQQSIEKALKSVLCFDGKPVPLTHDLELLVDRLCPRIVPRAEGIEDLIPILTLVGNAATKPTTMKCIF